MRVDSGGWWWMIPLSMPPRIGGNSAIRVCHGVLYGFIADAQRLGNKMRVPADFDQCRQRCGVPDHIIGRRPAAFTA